MSQNSEAVISAENIEKYYGYGNNTIRVLRGISMEIMRGESVSIVGPSGAGKSTLLNLFGCIDSFESGRLEVMGKDVSSLSVEDLSGFRNRHVGFVFQTHNLLPEFTALENCMLPLLIRREKWSRAKKAASEMLDRFGLSSRADHKPSEMSGGECQRAAVVRAIIGRPDIIMADEPTGNLDSSNSKNLAGILLEMGREYGLTVVIVTHDMELASMTGKTVSIIDGQISESGS